MDNISEKINNTEIEMHNVRCVIAALKFLETEPTEDELVKCFVASTDEPHILVEDELKKVLDHSVKNGWIVRNDNKYGLASREDEYQVDGDTFPRPKKEFGDDGDDSDIEYIDPNYSRYEVLSSPSAREAGEYYRRYRSHSPTPPPPPPPKKRKYTKRLPEPTTRVTRSASRAAASGEAGPSAPKKRKTRHDGPPTRFSSGTVAKGKGRRGGRTGGRRGR